MKSLWPPLLPTSSQDSNYAAKNSKRRRDEEAYWFSKLTECMPFPVQSLSKLDKGKLLRLAINYIRLKHYTKQVSDDLAASIVSVNGHRKETNGCVASLQESNLMLEALGGFLIFINRKGSIYYVSEQVKTHLGLDQADLIGRNVFEFLHKDDESELMRQIHEHPTCRNSISCLPRIDTPREKKAEELDNGDIVDQTAYIRERLFSVRMKCQMPRKKGNTTKQTGYCLMQWSGRMKLEPVKQECCRVVGLVALCRPMSIPIVEIRMHGNMFSSRHRLDMRFTHCDARIFSLIGYKPQELIGKTAYQFHNPQDAPKIYNCHSNLIVKGTSVSKYYRFLGKTGAWVWMQTRATIITNSNGTRYIICMNFIIGEEEGRRHLMMEQEERGLKGAEDSVGGAIDITSINSPVSAHSSGYSSADDDNLISPNNCSQFSPFNPDEDFTGTISFGGASAPSEYGLVQNSVTQNQGILKEGCVNYPTLSMSPMHNPNFEELIDVDAIFEPLPPLSTVAGTSQANQSLLAVSSAPVVTSTSSSGETLRTCQPAHSIASKRNGFSPLASSSVNMNSNFDNDIEMMDIEPDSSSSSATNNITINLPPGFNPKGQDGKSVLLDVLRKADKSQLLKIHEQINAAMASISQSKSNGKSVATPELQISITPAPNSVSIKPVTCSAAGPVAGPVASTASHHQAVAPPNGHATMANTPIMSMMSKNILGKNVAKTSSNCAVDNGICPSPMETGHGDNLCALFSDVDSQLPGYDILNEATTGSFSESLLNDVNLGTTAPVVITSNSGQTAKSPCPSRTVLGAQPTPVTSTRPQTVTKVKPANGQHVHCTKAVNARTCSPVSNHKAGDSETRGGAGEAAVEEHGIDMAAAVRGLDDHSYTSRCPSRHNNQHVKFAPAVKARRNNSAPVLEHLLTTKKPLNPMKGSDHVAQGIHKLAISDMEVHNGLNQPNLLKKLLTGEMDKNQGCGIQNASIYTRRGAVGPAPPSSSVNTTLALDAEYGFDDRSVLDSLDLLGPETGAEMDSLWNTPKENSNWNTSAKSDNDEIFGDIDELLKGESQSEIDDILRQETRHEDEWMKQFLDGLL